MQIFALETSHENPWRAVIAQSRAWADAQKLELRDAVMLLPLAQHLPLARQAWAHAGSWIPRVETVQSLARSLPPMPGQDPVAGQICFDVATDRLQAARMLRAQTWATQGAQAEPRAMAQAAASLVDTAHALARAAARVEPARRAAHWELARAWFGSSGLAGGSLTGGNLAGGSLSVASLGQRERLLCRIAVEWAAASADPSTDRLFTLRPSAWIVVQAGGPDALAQRLMTRGDVPGLWINTDEGIVDSTDEATDNATERNHSVALCENFEDEAQRATAAVICHLNQGRWPVALIAQDRALIRRMRALLDRQAIPVRDETGWKLSTTRAAASVHSLLSCALLEAAHETSTDAWLDCLKAAHAGVGVVDAALVDELERTWRRFGVKQARHGELDALSPAARDLLRHSLNAVALLTERPARALAAWLDSLRSALQHIGLWSALQSDEAGLRVLDSLQLLPEQSLQSVAFHTDAVSLQAFTEWVDHSLESATFIPSSLPDAAVVITPLAQAALRPFAAVVFPGADSKHLGVPVAANGLLSDADALALGVPTREEKRVSLQHAFAQICKQPELTFLRRVDDDGDPLSISPLLAQWTLKLARAGTALPAAGDARMAVEHAPAPVSRPLPQAPSLLPKRLSASACEALRACPYRFFALRMLRLQAVDELETELQKRDYGTWLHAVLHQFHLQRSEAVCAEDEAYALHQAAELAAENMALDEAEFLPYRASFSRFVPRYVAWLHERDAQGAQWLDGERKFSALPPSWNGVSMEGVIDRVDSLQLNAGGTVTQLIDYKTGQAAALRAAVHQGEDTQLPYYAALMAAQSEAVGEIAASYLFLDESERIVELSLPEVQLSADVLVQGLGRELQRIRESAPLPALGEGRSCDFCEARGLCRKDDWAAEDLLVEAGA